MNRKRIFMPMTIDSTEIFDRISQKRVILAAACYLALGLATIAIFLTSSSKVVKIVTVLADIFLAILILWRILYNGKLMLRLYREQKDNSKTTLKAIWNIADISESGIVYYFSGEKAVLLAIVHGTVAKLTEKELELVQAKKARMFKVLAKEGYSFEWLDRNSTKLDMSNLNKLEDLIPKHQNPALKALAEDILKTNRMLTHTYGRVCKQFVLVRTKRSINDATILRVCREALRELTGYPFLEHKIVDKRGFLSELPELTGVPYIDYEELKDNVLGPANIMGNLVHFEDSKQNNILGDLGIVVDYSGREESSDSVEDLVLSEEEKEMLKIFEE